MKFRRSFGLTLLVFLMIFCADTGSVYAEDMNLITEDEYYSETEQSANESKYDKQMIMPVGDMDIHIEEVPDNLDIPVYNDDSLNIASRRSFFRLYSSGRNYNFCSNEYGRNHLTNDNMKMAYDALNAYMNDVNNGNVDFDSYFYRSEQNSYLYSLKGFEFAKYNISEDQAYKVVLSMEYDHPEYFWLATSYFSFSTGTDTILWYPIVYEKYCTREKRSAMKEKIENTIDNEYSSIFNSDLSDYEKEKKIHDKVAFGTIYDPNYRNSNVNVDNHNIAGVLIDHVAVCESYAKTMQLLLNKAGVENIYIVGTSEGEGHAWNKVKLGENYYNLDSTWDSNRGDYYYFNRSDSNFQNHDAYTPRGTETRYLYDIPSCSVEDEYSHPDKTDTGETESILINPNEITLTSKASYYLNLTFTPENSRDKDVTWHSSNENVVKVINSQLSGKNYSVLVPVSNGSAVVTCNLTDSPQISSNECTVTVDIPDTKVSSITLPESITFTNIGQCKKITPIIAPNDATNKIVKWSCDSDKFTIDEQGNIITNTNVPCTAIVTCTSLSNPSVCARCTVKIVRGEPSIKYIGSIDMINNNINIDLSQENTYDLKNNIKIKDTEGNNISVDQAPLKWKDELNKYNILKVDEDTGIVTASSAGTTTISCSAQDREITNDYGASWDRVKGTCTITVTGIPSEQNPDPDPTPEVKKVTGITLSESAFTLEKVGDTKKITAEITPEDAADKNVAWTSSNPSVATVDSTGKVTAVGNGTADITCTAKDGSGKSAKCTVTVRIQEVTPTPDPDPTPEVKKVTGITLSESAFTLEKVGDTKKITAEITPEDAADKNVAWTSSNPSVATVDSTGKVTAVGNGTADITCTAKDGSGKSSKCTVTVRIQEVTPIPDPEPTPTVKKVTGITLNKTSFTLTSSGETQTITADINPSDASDKSVTWTSGNPSVATVDSTGKVTAVGNGTTIITCIANDGSGIRADITVTVKLTETSSVKALKKCSISGSERVGKTLKVTVKDEDNNVVTKDLKYTWYRLNKKDSSDKKEVGDEKTYKLRSGDKNKYIEVVVTDSNNNEVSDITGKIEKQYSDNDDEDDDNNSSSNKNSSNSNKSGYGNYYYGNNNGTLSSTTLSYNGNSSLENINGNMVQMNSVTGSQSAYSYGTQFNWASINGKWYLSDSTGHKLTGWQFVNGSWYLLGSNGQMATGWQYADGKWYYLYSSGAMASSTIIDGYTLGSDGAMI